MGFWRDMFAKGSTSSSSGTSKEVPGGFPVPEDDVDASKSSTQKLEEEESKHLKIVTPLKVETADYWAQAKDPAKQFVHEGESPAHQVRIQIFGTHKRTHSMRHTDLP